MWNYMSIPYKYRYYNIVIIYNIIHLYKNNTIQSIISLYYVKFYRNDHVTFILYFINNINRI